MRKAIGLVFVAAVVAVVFQPTAHASSIDFTIYCTDANNCSTTNPGSGQYWSFTGGVTTGMSGANQTFDMNLTIAASAGASAANLLSWSMQMGPNSATITSSTVVTSAGGTLEPGKSNNGNDSCNTNLDSGICDTLVANPVAITTGGLHWEVTGTFTGSFGTDCGGSGGTGNCLVLLADSAFASGGKTAFAISQDVSGNGTQQTPEPASMALFGTGLMGIAGVLRRKIKK